MNLIKFCMFLLSVIFSSCSTSFDSFDEKVSISTASNHVFIHNQLCEDIYYFVVEQQILAVINWAPSKSGPVIKSGKSLEISLTEIFNGKSDPVKSGDKVVIY